MHPARIPGFRRLFDDLLGYGISRGIPFHDAEDLVASTLEAALTHFDAAKGAFRSLCFKTLSNLIKNYWRDRKPNDPIGETDIPDPEPNDSLEGEEERVRMKEMIDRIRKNLTPEEETFLKALGTALEDLDSRAVSEAARSLGIEPQKGWDIFRKIQRKAKALFPSIAEEEVTIRQGPWQAPRALLHVSQASARYDRRAAYRRTTLLDLARLALREEAFRRALGCLTPEQVSRLQKILS